MKTDKRALLAYAEQNGFKYQKSEVWGKFSIFGGGIGGILLGILTIIFNLFSDKYQSVTRGDFLMFFVVPFLFGFLGTFVGIVPATFTGYFIARKKIIITRLADYGYLFVIGTFFTFICLLILLVIFKEINNLKDLSIIIPSMLGGATAMICGKLFLPKLPKDF